MSKTSFSFLIIQFMTMMDTKTQLSKLVIIDVEGRSWTYSPLFFFLPTQICRGGQVTPTLGPNACTALFIVEMEIKSLVAIT